MEGSATPRNPLLLTIILDLIFGKKASVVLILLVVDKVSPEEGAGVEQLVQLPEEKISNNIICGIIWHTWVTAA